MFKYLVKAIVHTVFGHFKLKSQWQGDKQDISDNTTTYPRRIVRGVRSEARKHDRESRVISPTFGIIRNTALQDIKMPVDSETKQTGGDQNI